MGTWIVIPSAVLALTVAAGAQAPSPSQETRQVFRSTASLVALSVIVTDGDKLVTGLHASDFEVYEDGVRQEVRFFESSSVPMDVILLLDASASMRARMPAVHDAARTFMKVLGPEDRGAVVAFNEGVRVLQDLTSDAAAIEQAIGSTSASGSTALYNALYVALKQFGRTAGQAGEVRRQAIAVLSDGEDTTSVVTFDHVIELARRVGVNIYTIGLRSRAATNLRRVRGQGEVSDADYRLRSLARETGARAFFPGNAHELKDVYRDIAAELEAQYSIAYAPANTAADGEFRRVLVRVTANPDYRPRARTGYTAASSTGSGSLSPLR